MPHFSTTVRWYLPGAVGVTVNTSRGSWSASASASAAAAVSASASASVSASAAVTAAGMVVPSHTTAASSYDVKDQFTPQSSGTSRNVTVASRYGSISNASFKNGYGNLTALGYFPVYSLVTTAVNSAAAVGGNAPVLAD